MAGTFRVSLFLDRILLFFEAQVFWVELGNQYAFVPVVPLSLADDDNMLRRRFVLVGLAASASWSLTSSAQDAAPDLEVDLVRQLMAIGALTLLASRIALPELKIPKLLAFANFEVAEQEASWSILPTLAGSDTLTDTADAPPIRSSSTASFPWRATFSTFCDVPKGGPLLHGNIFFFR